MAKLGLLSGSRNTPEEIKRANEINLFTFLAVLAAIFGLTMSIYGGYVAWVCFHLYHASILLAVIGAILSGLGVVGILSARTENYSLMYTYVYGVVLMTPIILLATVACFSFHDNLTGFVKHSWDRGAQVELRELFCDGDTADRTCRAPVHGGEP
jgi:hypothetical protein